MSFNSASRYGNSTRVTNRYAKEDSSSPFRNRKFRIVATLTGAIFVLALTSVGFTTFNAAAVTGSFASCTVTDKDRASDGEGGSDMRIYTEGCNDSSAVKVFSVADNVFIGEFASADTFASIEVGETYDFETRGSRIPLLSMFENIVGVTVSK